MKLIANNRIRNFVIRLIESVAKLITVTNQGYRIFVPLLLSMAIIACAKPNSTNPTDSIQNSPLEINQTPIESRPDQEHDLLKSEKSVL